LPTKGSVWSAAKDSHPPQIPHRVSGEEYAMALCLASEIQQSTQNDTIYQPVASESKNLLPAVCARVCAGSCWCWKSCFCAMQRSSGGLADGGKHRRRHQLFTERRRRYNVQARLQRFLSGFPGSGMGNEARCFSITLPVLMLEQASLSQV
jgi:hypothetical protein